jgi:hypothetical protein
MIVRLASWLILMLIATVARAHEVRPSYLEITEQLDGSIAVLWKQPATTPTPLMPRFSTGWTDGQPLTNAQVGEALVRTWAVGSPHAPLTNVTLDIVGLERTISDVLVRVTYADGTELTRLLKPSQPQLTLPSASKVTPPVREYLQLGFTHIWSGIDHLLYVLGLVLLVNNRWLLLKTITGFTVAHSITLAAAALGYVHIPAAPVEAVIALSIVYVAIELVHKLHGRVGLAQRAPWVVAMSFGLLHGLGFAGALAEVGLPAHAIPQALLLFNIGIELGQLAFVALVLAAGFALLRLAPIHAQALQWVPAYGIGSLASFWVIERIHSFI